MDIDHCLSNQSHYLLNAPFLLPYLSNHATSSSLSATTLQVLCGALVNTIIIGVDERVIDALAIDVGYNRGKKRVTECSSELASAGMPQLIGTIKKHADNTSVDIDDILKTADEARLMSEVKWESENWATVVNGPDLRSLKVAICTSDNRENTEVFLQRMGLTERFAHLACSSDSDWKAKPDPSNLHRVCSSLGVKPEEVWYVGDSSIDMAMGKDANVALTVGVLSGTGNSDSLSQADVIIDGILALTALL